MKQKGFTLIELLVVISIIGLLASIVLVSLNSARSKARYTRVLADMKQIAQAAELALDSGSTGKYPLDVGPDTLPTEMSGFMTRWPKPPCSGWTYDWENWNSDNDILISLRRADVGQVYIYCIYTTGNCVSGASIQNVTSKQITCSE